MVAEPYRHLFDHRTGAGLKAFSEMRSYAGKDAMETLWCWLREDTDVMHQIVTGLDGDVAPSYDPEAETMQKIYWGTHDCCFCGQTLPEQGMELTDPTDMRVFDHDHFTGRFRGIAHSRCNLKASIKKNYKVDIFFHNLGGYDIFHLLKSIGELQEGWTETLMGEPTKEDPTGIRDTKIDVLAKSTERFTTLTWGKRAVFKDTYQFVQASLDTLVRNLANSLTTLEEKKRVFRLITTWYKYKGYLDDHVSEEKDFDMLLKKGVYPYTFAKSMQDLYDTKKIPPKEAYTTELRGAISDGEYSRADWFWCRTRCDNMMDNTLYYNELDVLLLASVFEAFREAAIKPYPDGYGLDPAHFVTIPSFSYSAMLYFNMQRGVVVETLAETDDGCGAIMFGMAEQGIRGGICQVLHPYAHANIMTEEEVMRDAAKADCGTIYGKVVTEADHMSGETSIEYDDANNLYGGAMSEPMPLDDFKLVKKSPKHVVTLEEWKRRHDEVLELRRQAPTHDEPSMGLSDQYLVMLERDLFWLHPDMDQVNRFVCDDLEDEDPMAYLVDVDVHIPRELHDHLNDLPPFPENKLPPNPSPHTISQYEEQGELAQAFRCNKLILDLNDKKGYLIHSRLLQFYIQLGCQITAVNRVVSFRQSRWLRDYIDFNNQMRKEAKNEVDKSQKKLMNNAIFGKTMENVRAHRDIKFILPHQWTQAVKDASGPRFRHARIIVPDKMLLIEKAKATVTANRPIMVGQAVLDISKLIMYRHWYGAIKPQFGERVKLCYTDTDSFVYLLAGQRGKTIAQEKREMHARHNMFDLSEIQDPDNNPMTRGMTKEQIKANEKVLNKLKSESKGIPILEAVFLRSKTYSIKLSAPIVERHHNKKKAAMGKTVPKDHIVKKKGIPRRLPDDQNRLLFGHESYADIYYQGGKGKPVRFPSISHTKKLALYTAVCSKAGLSNLDDKNYWLNAAVCLRYGHWRAKKYAKKLLKPELSSGEIYIEEKLVDQWVEEGRRSTELMLRCMALEQEYIRSMKDEFLADCAMLPDEGVSVTPPPSPPCVWEPGVQMDWYALLPPEPFAVQEWEPPLNPVDFCIFPQ